MLRRLQVFKVTRRAGWAATIVAVLFTLTEPAVAETIPGPIAAHVLRVIDGDSLLVEIKLWFGQTVIEHVRIAGIDAPEMKGRCASEIEAARGARQYLAGLVGGRDVELRDVRREKYGRALARVAAGGVDVSTQMIDTGQARPYGGGRRLGWC